MVATISVPPLSQELQRGEKKGTALRTSLFIFNTEGFRKDSLVFRVKKALQRNASTLS